MKILLSSVGVMVAFAACAVDFYMKNGASDWTTTDSFTMDAEGSVAATSVPGTGEAQADAVLIPAGYTVYLNDRASLANVNKLDRIRPMNATASLVITVPEGECWTNSCPFNYDGANRFVSRTYGKLIKRGTGTLELVTDVRYFDGTYNTDYCSSLFAEQGTLVLPQYSPLTKVFHPYELSVSAGATLVTCIGITTYPCLLSGGGTITNRSSSVQKIFVMGSTSNASLYHAVSREFSGVMCGRIGLVSATYLNLTGVSNTFNGGVDICNNAGRGHLWNGIMGVTRFGKKGQPSSFGMNNTVNIANNPDCPGGIVLMLGTEEETTDRDFTFYVRNSGNVESPAIFDAGAFGGVTFTGNICKPSADQGDHATFKNAILVWTGSNTTHECVYRGANVVQTVRGTNYMTHIVKRGTGIWHLADQTNILRVVNEGRSGLSGFTVENGTFRYDSLSRKGDPCSLGLGTNTMEPYQGYYDPSKAVDWTFALGTTNAEGSLEYSGTNHVNAYSRPFVMRGDARLVNSTAEAYVRYRALPPEGANAKTLTLDGSNTLDNEVADVTDTMAAPVSVVKKGGGKWILGGNLTFHGGVDVQGGELVVRKYPQKYSWFKWLIKENSITERCPTATEIVQSHMFALYDKDLVCHTIGLQQVTNAACVLQPGQATFEANRYYTEVHNGTYRPMGNIFLDYAGGYGMYVIPYKADRSGALRPTRANPDSWMPIVMRMTNNAPEIVGWDYVLAYGAAQDGSNRSVCGYSIEGSVDGMHWDDLTGDIFHPSNTLPTANMKWVSGGTANKAFVTGDAARHKSNGAAFALSDDFKFTRTRPDAFSVFENVGAVKVAAGAKLTADGDGIGAISSISVDASGDGTGTIDGFALSGAGILEVENLPRIQGETGLPLVFTNCTGAENISAWTLDVNGAGARGHRVRIRDGRLCIMPKGTVVNIR